MAKAREIEDLDCDEPFALAAARVVGVRAGELFEHSRGVLDTAEIERVHAMRVASRRLRAAMEIFEPCFPGKPFRRSLKRVKELADALGERRDRDVAIAFLEELSAHLTAPDRRGIATLIEQLRAEQTVANEALAAYVTAERLVSLQTAIGALCDQAAAAVTDAEPEPLAVEASTGAEVLP